MKNKKSILGVKGFDKDLRCRGHQYEIGETYEQDCKPEICKAGFHFSMTLNHVYSFYPKKDNT